MKPSNINQSMTRDGFILIKDRLEVAPILEIYQEHIMVNKKRTPATQTVFNKYGFYSKEMNPHLQSDKVWNLIHSPKIEECLMELLKGPIVCINSIFVAKEPKSNSFLTPHQDNIYWGLRTNGAVSVWIAITGTNEENGCMQVLPGSHKSPRYHKQEKHIDNILQMGEKCPLDDEEEKMMPIELNPGEFSIHHCQTVHMSNRNRSNNWRIGLVGRYAELDALSEEHSASKCYTYMNIDNQHSIYKPDGDFVLGAEQKRKVFEFNRKYYRVLNNSAARILR
ncbi:phytanoyl-CoA dioxygenase family protein [Prochlorococcus sp. MIT 1306]|uniref:phytanoyl-CoA dioxygenase family protein n=1 Tax=Prochlorococcus sp. MIT 1306 TaxID=1799667 RepID=UPI0007BC1EB2|nr:phytanoyl-CoA dioxygenase family protein [Prochlorococcus sp. MIT 1306]KZR65043.1 Phytanoyl-CoA dioxygenase (PhyH) [Prochlorococcus sp. MIT 1306]